MSGEGRGHRPPGRGGVQEAPSGRSRGAAQPDGQPAGCRVRAPHGPGPRPAHARARSAATQPSPLLQLPAPHPTNTGPQAQAAHPPDASAEMDAAPTPLATSEMTYPMKMPTGEAKVKGSTTDQKRCMEASESTMELPSA